MGTYSKNFFRCMKECKDEITKARDAEAGKVWLTIKSFAESGEYSSYKKASDLVKLVIGGYNDNYIAKNLGIEEATVRIHKRNISNELYKLLGEDFFELLKQYKKNKKEIEVRVKSVENISLKSTDLIASDILAIVNTATIEPIRQIDLNECKGELSFLLKHSIYNIQQESKGLDVNKIHYLLGIINSDVGTPDDRYYIINLLTGGKRKNEND